MCIDISTEIDEVYGKWSLWFRLCQRQLNNVEKDYGGELYIGIDRRGVKYMVCVAYVVALKE